MAVWPSAEKNWVSEVLAEGKESLALELVAIHLDMSEKDAHVLPETANGDWKGERDGQKWYILVHMFLFAYANAHFHC